MGHAANCGSLDTDAAAMLYCLPVGPHDRSGEEAVWVGKLTPKARVWRAVLWLAENLLMPLLVVALAALLLARR